MKIAAIIIRTLMGLLLLFASVSYFFHTMKEPMPVGAAKTYNEGLAVVHLMDYVKAIELVCGLLLVIGRYVTLAVLVIFPILINIVLFHAVIDPKDVGAGLALLLGNFFLAYYYRRNYASLFAAK